VRVADYIAGVVAGLGVTHVFVVTGGGAMHLDDALGLRDDLDLVFCHHEQACAIAVEGYARTSGRIGVACVTTGPGGTNALTGVLGQWHDSVPALYVSGQVRFDTTVASTRLPLRQLGDQEADITRLVAPITKYAVSVTDPATVRYHAEKAVWLATHGRPGPVWLDVPLNVQAAQVEPDGLARFDPAELDGQDRARAAAVTDASEDAGGMTTAGAGDVTVAGAREAAPSAHECADAVTAGLRPWPPVTLAPQAPGAFCGRFDEEGARAAAAETLGRLRAAERPVILAGSAIRTAGVYDRFLEHIGRLGVPVCTAWNAADLLWDQHPLYAGRPGTVGQRSGNFVLQNADLALVLGCRLNIRQVGYESPAFAHHAFRIVVDLDEAELAKPTITPHLAVHADVGFFLDEVARLAAGSPEPDRSAWVAWCRERLRRYPPVDPAFRERSAPVNPYVFVECLSGLLEPGDEIVCANGSACVVTLQALTVKRGQRILVNSGTAGMGYDLPAAVGAAFARRVAPSPRGSGEPAYRQRLPVRPRGRVVCLAGDGSIQMNVQELQTIVQHELPVKVFVFGNAGYVSIRQTQDNLFDGRRVGEGPRSGVTFPDMVALAESYGIAATRVARHQDLVEAVGTALVSPGPALVDIIMDPEQPFVPKVAAERLPDGTIVSKPLEDMSPLLDRAEFADNMLVPPYDPPVR